MSEREASILLYSDLATGADPLVDEGAEERRRAHFRLLTDAASELGLRPRSIGDGLLVVFDGVDGALDCAASVRTALSRINRGRNEPLDVRIALHAGGPVRVEEDYMGSDVAIARRIAAEAEGGRVVASENVHALAGDNGPTGITFRETSKLALRGDVSIATFDVVLPSGVRIELPIPLTRLPAFGEPAELSELAGCWKDSRSGGPRVAFVVGEAGAGKTALAAAFARGAYTDGATVLFGRAWSPSRTLGPVLEALRPYLSACRPRSLREHVRAAGPAVATLFQESAPFADGSVIEPDVLPQGLSLFLGDMSVDAPIVVVIDDAQNADPATLALLERVAAGDAREDVFVVASYDPRRLRHGTALPATLDELVAGRAAAVVRTRGLDSDAVADACKQRLGDKVPASVIRAVWDATGGNAVLVDEALRRLDDTPASRRSRVRLPESVEEVFGGRLAELGEDAVDRLARTCGTGEPVDLGDATDRASSLDLVTANESGVVVAHQVVRDLVTGRDAVEPAAKLDAAAVVQPMPFITARERTEAEPSTDVPPSTDVRAEPDADEPARADDAEASDARIVSDLPYEPISERIEVGVDLVSHVRLFPDGIDMPRATADMRQAASKLGGRDADPSACELHMLASMMNALEGRIDVARSESESARRLAIRLEDERAVALTDIVSAWMSLAEGSVDEALTRLDAAWNAGDASGEEVVAPLAARVAGWAHLSVLDLPGARVELMREIGKRRASRSSPERKLLGDTLAAVGALSGRIGEAVRLAETAGLEPSASTAQPIIAFCQGEFEDAEALWQQGHERARSDGRMAPWIADGWHAKLLRATGRPEAAKDLLADTLGSVYGAGFVPGELAIRADVALTCSILGDTENAERHLARCDEILAAREDWHGVGARVEFARAAYHGAMGITGAAVRGFERAADAFNHCSSPWDAAEAHQVWGRFLLGLGRNDGQAELDAAVRIYEECRAGRAWRDLAGVAA